MKQSESAVSSGTTPPKPWWWDPKGERCLNCGLTRADVGTGSTHAPLDCHISPYPHDTIVHRWPSPKPGDGYR